MIIFIMSSKLNIFYVCVFLFAIRTARTLASSWNNVTYLSHILWDGVTCIFSPGRTLYTLLSVWWCLVVSGGVLRFWALWLVDVLWRHATSRDVARRRAMSLSFSYTFLLTSLRVHKVPIIVSISCLVPMESSWAVHHDSKYISYVTKQQNEYWRKNCQNSCLSDQLHKDDTERNYVPDSSPVSRACSNNDWMLFKFKFLKNTLFCRKCTILVPFLKSVLF